MKAAKFREHRQQIKNGEFVGRDHQLSLLQFAQLGKRLGGLTAQIDELLGVFVENFSRVRKNPFARGAIEQCLPEFVFELADGLADGRLGAKQLIRGARKAALAGDGKKDFQLGKLHGTPLIDS